MSSLRNVITQLASQFATGVLNAIRGASLEEILAETRGGSAGLAAIARRSGRAVAGGDVEAAIGMGGRASKARRCRGGRLSRRSAEDIGEVVERIVSLLAQNPKGLRSEQIRQKLGLEAKELPRPIAEALAAKRITKHGQKRVTTYFAGGGKAAATKSEKAGASKGGRRAGRPAKPAKKDAKAGKGGKASKTAAKPAAGKGAKATKSSKKPAATPASTNGATAAPAGEGAA